MSYRSDISFARAQRAYENEVPGDDGGFTEAVEDWLLANAVCPYCKGSNTELLEDKEFLCRDCGEHYDAYAGRKPMTRSEIKDARAEYRAEQERDEK